MKILKLAIYGLCIISIKVFECVWSFWGVGASQNDQTHSKNLSAVVDELFMFDYFVGLARKGLILENWNGVYYDFKLWHANRHIYCIQSEALYFNVDVQTNWSIVQHKTWRQEE